MLQNRAYKFKLKPTRYQQELFNKTFGCTRLVYNLMLAERIETYERYKEEPAVLRTIKHPTPAKYKSEYEFLKEVDSLALSNAQLNLNKSFKNFFEKRAKFPRFKKKHGRNSYTTNNQKGSIRIENNLIKLPKVGWVKIVLHRQIPESHTIKSCTIERTPSGKYEISILTEFEHVVLPSNLDSEKSVGLDYSSADFFVTSDGEKANYPLFYRKSEEKLARLQKALSRKKKGSKNYIKNKIQIAKLHAKIANQRKDFLHKTVNELLRKYDYIFLEDLHMRGMSQSLKLGKSTMDNGFGMFRTFLQYKANFVGKIVFKINKWFPSSKTCSSCGNIQKITLKERVFRCDHCSHIEDRDVNAAKNIKIEGLYTLKL